MSTKNIKKVNEEFKDTKHNLYTSLNDSLANIKVTKDEIEKFKTALKEHDLSNERIEIEVAKYPITKKVQFILKEVDIHTQLDACIAFLDEALEVLQYAEEE